MNAFRSLNSVLYYLSFILKYCPEAFKKLKTVLYFNNSHHSFL